jgi:ribosomal protein S18 acetylase RimI-like enzyme
MKIAPLQREDLASFMAMALTERWLVESWEFDFLLANSPRGCFCARDDAGNVTGFVTSLAHCRSGWIGNLIVGSASRGSGIGGRLFLHALAALRESGAETCWLTASASGKPLYEKHGFSRIDTIIRWTGSGSGPAAAAPASGGAVDGELDHLGWDDQRDKLLAIVQERGKTLAADNAFAVVQPCCAAAQIGPFAALTAHNAAPLLDAAIAGIPAGTGMYIDAPAGNAAAERLLLLRGFARQGTNELMYAGARPDYRPEFIYGLASMGSMG